MMKKRGFTLIEMMITMSLVVVLSAVISSLYITGFRTFKEQMAIATIQSDGQTILDTMTTDIKNGLSVEPTYLTHVSDANSIIIRVPAVNSQGKIIYSGTNMLVDHIVYYYENKSIHKIVYADPASVRYAKNNVNSTLDNKILILGFSYSPDTTSATLVTVSISSEIKVGTRSEQIQLTGKARLRNHI